MNRILEEVILATEEDVPRFKAIIEEAVKQKKVKQYKIFEKTCKDSKKRLKKAKEEEIELNEDMKEENERSLEESLMLQMQKRKKNNIIDSLISKYGGDGDINEKDYDIDEEEFNKTKKKICKRKGKK